eukprot:Rmarinus@m.28050
MSARDLIEKKSEDVSVNSLIDKASLGEMLEVKRLLQFLDANAQDVCGETALTTAASNGHAEVCNLLIQRGANLDYQTRWAQETALHLAVKAGYGDVVKLLLERGASQSIKNKSGHCPIHIAASKDDVGIASMLVKFDADVISSCTDNGETPLHIAVYWDHIAMIDFLLKKKADPLVRDAVGRTCAECARSNAKTGQNILRYVNSSLMRQLESCQSEIEMLSNAQHTSDERIASLESSLTVETKLREECEMALKKAKSQLQAAVEAAKAIETTKAVVGETLEAEKQSKTELEAEVSTLRKQLRAAHKKTEEISSEFQDTLKSLKNAEDRCTAVNEEKDKIKEVLERKKKQADALLEERDELKAELRRQADALVMTREKLSDMNEALAGEQKSRVSLENRMDTLMARAESEQAQISCATASAAHFMRAMNRKFQESFEEMARRLAHDATGVLDALHSIPHVPSDLPRSVPCVFDDSDWTKTVASEPAVAPAPHTHKNMNTNVTHPSGSHASGTHTNGYLRRSSPDMKSDSSRRDNAVSFPQRSVSPPDSPLSSRRRDPSFTRQSPQKSFPPARSPHSPLSSYANPQSQTLHPGSQNSPQRTDVCVSRGQVSPIKGSIQLESQPGLQSPHQHTTVHGSQDDDIHDDGSTKVRPHSDNQVHAGGGRSWRPVGSLSYEDACDTSDWGGVGSIEKAGSGGYEMGSPLSIESDRGRVKYEYIHALARMSSMDVAGAAEKLSPQPQLQTELANPPTSCTENPSPDQATAESHSPSRPTSHRTGSGQPTERAVVVTGQGPVAITPPSGNLAAAPPSPPPPSAESLPPRADPSESSTPLDKLQSTTQTLQPSSGSPSRRRGSRFPRGVSRSPQPTDVSSPAANAHHSVANPTRFAVSVRTKGSESEGKDCRGDEGSPPAANGNGNASSKETGIRSSDTAAPHSTSSAGGRERPRGSTGATAAVRGRRATSALGGPSKHRTTASVRAGAVEDGTSPTTSTTSVNSSASAEKLGNGDAKSRTKSRIVDSSARPGGLRKAAGEPAPEIEEGSKKARTTLRQPSNPWT